MAKIAIIGGGDHARSLVEASAKADGYVDLEERPGMCGEWLGDDQGFMESCQPGEWEVHIGIVGTRPESMAERRKIIEKYAKYDHVRVIAPTAIITENAEIGAGTAVMQGATLNGARIGSDSVVNTGAIVEHGCVVGDNVFIGPGAIVCGGVEIGDDSFVGAGATIINGLKIAGGTMIGAGSTVTKDITEPGVYVGSPAKKMSER